VKEGLERVRDPHTLVDGAHGVELCGLLCAADQVRLDAAALQCVEQRAVGFLARADHDRIGLYHLRRAIDEYMQSGVVDAAIRHAGDDLNTALGEAAAKDPTGGHA